MGTLLFPTLPSPQSSQPQVRLPYSKPDVVQPGQGQPSLPGPAGPSGLLLVGVCWKGWSKHPQIGCQTGRLREAEEGNQWGNQQCPQVMAGYSQGQKNWETCLLKRRNQALVQPFLSVPTEWPRSSESKALGMASLPGNPRGLHCWQNEVSPW